MNNQEQQLTDNMHKQEEQHKKGMQDIIKPVKLKNFKAYPIIIALMAILQTTGLIYTRCFVDVFGLHVTLGPLFFTPVVLFIFQIVAECYGWQYSRQIVWCNVVVNSMFTILTFAISYIPISTFTHANLRDSYINLMNTMWVTSGLAVGAIFLADYFGTAVMATGKTYFRGKFLLLRMIAIHMGSELILVSTALIQMPYNGYSMAETYQSMWQMLCVRFFVVLLLAPFVKIAIWYIQERIEQVVAFDTGRDSWNIFHWDIPSKFIYSY